MLRPSDGNAIVNNERWEQIARLFLVNMPLDPTSPPIHVARNWTAGLKN